LVHDILQGHGEVVAAALVLFRQPSDVQNHNVTAARRAQLQSGSAVRFGAVRCDMNEAEFVYGPADGACVVELTLRRDGAPRCEVGPVKALYCAVHGSHNFALGGAELVHPGVVLAGLSGAAFFVVAPLLSRVDLSPAEPRMERFWRARR